MYLYPSVVTSLRLSGGAPLPGSVRAFLRLCGPFGHSLTSRHAFAGSFSFPSPLSHSKGPCIEGIVAALLLSPCPSVIEPSPDPPNPTIWSDAFKLASFCSCSYPRKCASSPDIARRHILPLWVTSVPHSCNEINLLSVSRIRYFFDFAGT